MRREVITLVLIHHPRIIPLLGTTTDSHHPLALISPYYSRGHALLYLKKLEIPARPLVLLEIVRFTVYLWISITHIAFVGYLHRISPPLSSYTNPSNHSRRCPCGQSSSSDCPASCSLLSQRNIVIDDDGNALLIDFGLARIKHEVTRSTTGLIEGGKYRYLAPELLTAVGPNDFRTTPASDCYAFAMTILELATLDRPWAEFSHELRAARAAEKGIRPIRPEGLGGLPTEVADELWALLERMWAQDALTRPSLDVVKAELERISSLLRPRTST